MEMDLRLVYGKPSRPLHNQHSIVLTPIKLLLLGSATSEPPIEVIQAYGTTNPVPLNHVVFITSECQPSAPSGHPRFKLTVYP